MSGLLQRKGFAQWLDWKFPGEEVISHYNACARAHELPSLSEEEADKLHRLDPIDERQDDIFFPDLAVPLDTHAKRSGHRLLGCDEDGDSMALRSSPSPLTVSWSTSGTCGGFTT